MSLQACPLGLIAWTQGNVVIKSLLMREKEQQLLVYSKILVDLKWNETLLRLEGARRVNTETWTLKRHRKQDIQGKKRFDLGEKKRLTGPEEKFVSSRTGPREPQTGDPLQETGLQGAPSPVTSRKTRGVKFLLCYPGEFTLQHSCVPRWIQKCSRETLCLGVSHILQNNSVELEKSSLISADLSGSVSQHCNQAPGSRRGDVGGLQKERASKSVHAGRGNWMHIYILNPYAETWEQMF